MPLYTYRCPDGHDTDHVFGITDVKPKTRPCGCGRRAVRVITGMPGVTFKGGLDAGWTTTKPEHRVTWGDVEKHIKHTKVAAKEDHDKRLKNLKNFVADHL